MRNTSIRLFGIVGAIFLLASCAPTIPKEALQLSPESLKDRQMQTRRFETDEKTLLSASAAVLQDLGFNLDESETSCGLIVCSKTRDATSAGQIAGAIVLALFTGAVTPVDKEQLIRTSLVTHPIKANDQAVTGQQTAVRITFQRIVINTRGMVTIRELINDPLIYQEFFEKLSKSVFLEAHDL